MRAGSHGFDLKKILNTHQITLPLMSIAQNTCSFLRTEKVDDFKDMIALTEGVYFSRLRPSFSKNNNSIAVLRNGVFQKTLFFSSTIFSGIVVVKQWHLWLDWSGWQNVATFERRDADNMKSASVSSFKQLYILCIRYYREEITNLHWHCEISFTSKLVLFAFPVKTPHSQSPSKVHIAGN